MFKIIFGNQGQRGDLIMNTVVARAIKEKFPNCHTSMSINKQYEDMKELFYNHPYIDSVSIWEGYDDWPTQNDINHAKNFDIILHPMPQHPNNHCWYNLVNYQTEAACIMNGFTPPKDLSCILNKYFEVKKQIKSVCISPFTAWERKNISSEKWQSIIDYIYNKGYLVFQIGSKNEYKFNNTIKEDLTYIESTKLALGCDLVIGLDGGFSWLMSAYKHPFLGLYGHSYDNLISPKVYEPINPNSTYLESFRAQDIPNDIIFQKIDELLK